MPNKLAFAPFNTEPAKALITDLPWPDDPAEIPDWIYTDRRIYDLEQQRIFGGRTWNYIGLEAELPKSGDYIRSYIGSTPVVVARDAEGTVHVFENRCAHRGAEFCKTYRGNTEHFTCPYHQWTYDLSGSLASVPFRRGVKGKGGMPDSFKLEEHNLRHLNVTCRNGVIFASFCKDMDSLADYLGTEMLDEFDTVFDGRKLKILGNHRNTVPSNWKLYQENLKDPYHATLLHTYLTTFGLFVAGNRTSIIIDPSGRHSALRNARPATAPVADEHKAQIKSFKLGMALADPRVLDFFPDCKSDWSSSAITIWPNLILLRQMNILSTRQIVPISPSEFLLVWTAFGYADDDEAMTQHRLRQNNIFGPGGFLGIDDHEALKFVQDGLGKSVPRSGIAALGDENDTPDTVITDRAIRLMYQQYRQEMGFFP